MKEFIRYIRIVIIRIYAMLRSKGLNMNGRILIVAPHPDDEVIGCSGLIQQFLAAGQQVYVCILTGGEGSHKGCCSIPAHELKSQRRNLAKSIDVQLGLPVENLYMLDFPDGNINKDNIECKKLRGLIEQLKPQSIFVPHQKGEGWSDHIEAGNIVKKIIKGSSIHLYEYCVWFWYYNVWGLDWKNARLLMMTRPQYQNKLKAIHNYISPLAPCGKPYSGVLPKMFIRGNQWSKELYFRVK